MNPYNFSDYLTRFKVFIPDLRQSKVMSFVTVSPMFHRLCPDQWPQVSAYSGTGTRVIYPSES